MLHDVPHLQAHGFHSYLVYVTAVPLMYLSLFFISLVYSFYSMTSLLADTFATKSTQTSGGEMERKFNFFRKVISSKSLLKLSRRNSSAGEKVLDTETKNHRSRLPILSKQCAKLSEQRFLLNKNVVDQIRTSTVEEEPQRKGLEGDILLDSDITDTSSMGSSLYSLICSTPLYSSSPKEANIHPSKPCNEDNIEDTDSVIFGLGDLNDLNAAESILSFDGDLDKVPFYREVIL